MSRAEAILKYQESQKRGMRFYKQAVSRGQYPYPPVLDDIVDMKNIAATQDLGLIDIPAELLTGTKSSGRTFALAGNFMPLLDESTEFASKWISLCEAHLSDEGIRDPVKCYEYLGSFYVEEGNKRVSVLKSYDAPVIPATVTRLIPAYTEDPEIRVYYEFMDFYALSGFYGLRFLRKGDYAALQAALGFEPLHKWTETERLSFKSGFLRFREAFQHAGMDSLPVTPSEALLVWLGVFPFSELRQLSVMELEKQILALRADIRGAEEPEGDLIELKTDPDPEKQSIFSMLLGTGKQSHVSAAFIYAFDPKVSAWTRAHEHGREYLEQVLGNRCATAVYEAFDRNYYDAMEKAVADGADVLFATTPPMIDACRRIAALHRDVRVLDCAISMPYTGVRTYYCRQYECKFITGAIAGAMADRDEVGYIENYPIFGVPASINAFALGVRMTNPRAKVILRWSCLPGDPLQELRDSGISVISNRDATNPANRHWALEWGTYKIGEDGAFLPLAVPCWDWGKFYERVVRELLNGTLESSAEDKAINYWWGLDTGVINIQMSDSLPDGVRSLAELLKAGIISGAVDPFCTRIYDQNGTLRNDGAIGFSAEDLMNMDWLCDNVDGRIPSYSEVSPVSQELLRLLGFERGRAPYPYEKEAQGTGAGCGPDAVPYSCEKEARRL